MELQDIRRRQAEFDRRHAGPRPWDEKIDAGSLDVLEHLTVCLAGEVGEFANVVKKTVRGDISFSDAKPALAEELADAFIYIVKICNQMDVDLESEFMNRLSFNAERFRRFETPGA